MKEVALGTLYLGASACDPKGRLYVYISTALTAVRQGHTLLSTTSFSLLVVHRTGPYSVALSLNYFLTGSVLVALIMAAPSDGRMLKKADPSTIQNKFLVGYQGWFTCPGDGPPLDPHHHGWLHWFTSPIPDGGRPNTDLWPDVSEYSPSELFAAPGLKFANGDQAFVFSSRNARTVERHFHWMALHGVDGAFLQRFLGQCDVEGGNEAIRNQRDEVGDLVKQAAEKEGRTYAIM